MANCCVFDARVKGEKKNVLKFADWMGAYYSYGSEEPICLTTEKENGGIPAEHHIGWRVFDTVLYGMENIASNAEDDTVVVELCGSCAWSCHSCMFEGIASYCSDNKDSQSLSLTLPEACELLHVEVELFSSESGIGFAERYHISSDGEILIGEEEDYEEFCIDDWSNYDTFVKEYAEAEKHVSRDLFEKAKEKGDTYVTVCAYFENNEPGDYSWPFTLTKD